MVVVIVLTLGVFELMPGCSKTKPSESGSQVERANKDSTLHPLKAETGTGCFPREESGSMNWHWCGSQGEIVITNHGDSERKIALEGVFVAGYNDPSDLLIEGDGYNAKLDVSNKGTPWKAEIAVKPGATALRLRCDCKRVIAPNDPRAMFFQIANFQYREVDNP
jgi:hypothetical protein